MADNPVVHFGENSPEQVAYRLLRNIAYIEKKRDGLEFKDVDRKWLLDTYAECLDATLNRRSFPST